MLQSFTHTLMYTLKNELCLLYANLIHHCFHFHSYIFLKPHKYACYARERVEGNCSFGIWAQEKVHSKERNIVFHHLEAYFMNFNSVQIFTWSLNFLIWMTITVSMKSICFGGRKQIYLVLQIKIFYDKSEVEFTDFSWLKKDKQPHENFPNEE